jgi:uncharacterized protein YqgQ
MSLKGNLKRVEKGYITDLENVIKDISEKYNVYIKNRDGSDGMMISEDELVHVYISPMLEQEKQYQCSAILVNGNRCSHKSLKETHYRYCKKHIFKDNQNKIKKTPIVEETNDETNNIITTTNILQKCTIDSNNANLKKHFINDKLYYIDDYYIYEMHEIHEMHEMHESDNLTKAGYIEKDDDSDNVNYVLIDDPFILQNI